LVSARDNWGYCQLHKFAIKKFGICQIGSAEKKSEKKSNRIKIIFNEETGHQQQPLQGKHHAPGKELGPGRRPPHPNEQFAAIR
jgi:hypothetical protein